MGERPRTPVRRARHRGGAPRSATRGKRDAVKARGDAIELRAPTAEATREIGETIGRHAPEGAVALVTGPLGAGKTTFAQGVAVGCGVEGRVTSPTYNLIHRHAGERPFIHVDLFRLVDDTDLETLDLDEFLAADGVACVEWPERIAERVSPPRADVRILRESHGERTITIDLRGPGWERARTALEDPNLAWTP